MKALVRAYMESDEATNSIAKGVFVKRLFNPVMSTYQPG